MNNYIFLHSLTFLHSSGPGYFTSLEYTIANLNDDGTFSILNSQHTCTVFIHMYVHMKLYTSIYIHIHTERALSDFRAEFLVFTILILII